MLIQEGIMGSRGRHVEAILWVVLSTAIFTVIFAAAKFAGGAMGTFQVLFLRYAGALGTVLVLAPVLAGRRGQRRGPFRPSPAVGRHVLRAALGVSAVAAITWASAHMPVADASAMGMLYGVSAVLLGVVVLGEHVGMRQWLAIVISLVGAAVVMASQGAFRSGLVAVPALVALASAVLMASEGLMIRVLSQTETALSMMLHVGVFGLVLVAVPAALDWRQVGVWTALGHVALGPLGVFGQYCTIRGYRIAPLSVVGPVDHTWLGFAAVLGLVAFGEIPGWGTVVGGGLIVLGGVLLSTLRDRAG
ncbi:MAG: DMT family transporter [Paracoccaceae bacterium]